MTQFPKHPCPTSTPWGRPEYTKELAPGIWHISTMSHGGIWLSPERRQAMPPDMDHITWLASDEWFEEDCDAAWPIIMFPEVGADPEGSFDFLKHYTAGNHSKRLRLSWAWGYKSAREELPRATASIPGFREFMCKGSTHAELMALMDEFANGYQRHCDEEAAKIIPDMPSAPKGWDKVEGGPTP